MRSQAEQLAEWDQQRLEKLRASLNGAVGLPRDEIIRRRIEDHHRIGDTDSTTIELSTDSTASLGEIWTLGRHRLMCGDSTSADQVELLMNNELAEWIVTDPPYGVDIQERDLVQAEVRGRRKDGKGVVNDNLTGDELAEFLLSAFSTVVRFTKPGAIWYVFAPPGVDYRHHLNALAELDIARHGLVWVKDRFVMGRADYHYRHENIIYGWTPGGPHRRLPERLHDSVFECTRPGASPDHPTMKPVKLVEQLIGSIPSEGEIVLEPFGGSGSTLVACERTGRRCYAMELDPRYCDAIIHRWEKYTGQTAELLK